MVKSPQIELAAFDDAYISALRAGDAETARHFATYFSKLLDIKLRCRLRNPALVEDIRQETLQRVLGILQRRDALRDASRLGAFVNTVCNNVLFEHWRSVAKTAGEEECPEVVDGSRNPEQTLGLAENVSRLQAALLQIPQKDRQVLKLLYLDELDRSEVSDRIGVSQRYLRVLVHRALLRLRKSMEKTMAEGSVAWIPARVA